MHTLRFRQIHLDFHTSPHIPDIGKAFDEAHWQRTLRRGHVDSITLFATCHHGYAYYDTQVGQRHPRLGFDLLRKQFDATKAIGINAPIYLTAGVNDWAAHNNPQWREVGHDGRYTGWAQSVTQPGFAKMCFNTPYLDLLCKQINEVTRAFPDCDGIFLDIISQGQCCCRWCLASMEQRGLDATNEDDRKQNAKLTLEKYYKATTAAARIDDPNMPVFHNSGHIARGQRDILQYFSHLELESLPTGGWGYDHFPLSAKYCTQLEHDFLGMTGKFHTTWGEFGGYKHPNALRYECAAAIAFGGKCSIGDQLHPNGKLDESTYEIIGAAYQEVQAKEPWCSNIENVADLALLSSEAVNGPSPASNTADVGATRILLESHFLFDVIDSDMPFEKYKALILPDNIRVDAQLKTKLDTYLAQGGQLILTGDSGLDETGESFLFDLGVEFAGKSEFNPDYIAPIDAVRPTFCNSPMVMYDASNRIKATTGQGLGKIHDPYFNRTWKHFSSHQHTPYKIEPSDYDCGVIHQNILYLAHPVFTIYSGYGAVAYKDYITNSIRHFMANSLTVQTNLPSTARINLTYQAEHDRHVLHLLYANTLARGGAMELSGGNTSGTKSIEVIEELLPLHDVEVKLTLSKPIKQITLEPQGKTLPFKQNGSVVTLHIDSFTCHQMVVLK